MNITLFRLSALQDSTRFPITKLTPSSPPLSPNLYPSGVVVQVPATPNSLWVQWPWLVSSESPLWRLQLMKRRLPHVRLLWHALVFHCNMENCSRVDSLTSVEHLHTFFLVANRSRQMDGRSLNGLSFSLFKWLT
jgi:hypothetical protein